jgi:hypothetical protein
LDGSSLHVRPRDSKTDFNRDLIRFNLINVDDNIYIIQNVATGDYLEGGNKPFRENKIGTEVFPNWIRWKLIPFEDAYIIECVENGWMVDAGQYHLRQPNVRSNPSWITWDIINSV